MDEEYEEDEFQEEPRLGSVMELAKRGLRNAGRPRRYGSPEELASECAEYIRWCENNTLFSVEARVVDKTIEKVSTPRMRAMTIEGLCLYLSIGYTTWLEYRAKPEYKDLCSQVEYIIRTQKFAGAAAGLLKENIISRDLGLADRGEFSGPGGGPIQHELMSEEQAKQRMLDLGIPPPSLEE